MHFFREHSLIWKVRKQSPCKLIIQIEESMFVFLTFIVNVKIHPWKGRDERFDDILKISAAGFSCSS